MTNPVQTNLQQADGSKRYVIIEPILKKDAPAHLHETGIFKIYKDAFGDESHLFTEPAENEGQADDLPDEQNPDYLGRLHFSGKHWRYEGSGLNNKEQETLAKFIRSAQSSEAIEEFPESANPPEDPPLNPGSLS
jgi:hypothetical protein